MKQHWIQGFLRFSSAVFVFMFAACALPEGRGIEQPKPLWSVVIEKPGEAPAVSDLSYDSFSGFWSVSVSLEESSLLWFERQELDTEGLLYDRKVYGGGLARLSEGARPIPITEEYEGFKSLRLDPETLFINLVDSGGWGIIGSATAGGWERDLNMSYNKKSKTWSITLELKIGDFKFRQGDSWDTNLGGTDLAKLSFGGGNYRVTEAGTYTVTLNPAEKRATIAKL